MRPLVVGYALRMFPQLSETFLANEIVALERLGVSLRVYSYRRPRAEVHHDCVRRIRAPIAYLPDPLWRHPRAILQDQRAWRAVEPKRHRGAVALARDMARRERSPQPLKRLLSATSLAMRARADRVTHLHAHFAHEATRVVMLASILTGIPYSFTAHARDIYSDDVDFELLREKLERARFAVTVSHYNREHIAAHVGDKAAACLHVAYNGVDLDKFAPDPAVRREERLVLGVGRLVEKKGFAVLIEACRLLRDRGRRFRCEIVGGGELRAPLQAQVGAAGLGGLVTLAGERSQEELPALYRRASVVAMPAVIAADGNRDALPTVLLEAAACGLPTVASRLTGIAEIVDHGHTGLLVEAGDAEGLSRALELLLDDAGLRVSMGAAARARVEERFDLDVNVQRLHALLTGEVPDAARVPVV